MVYVHNLFWILAIFGHCW